jgi:hypothetical protein
MLVTVLIQGSSVVGWLSPPPPPRLSQPPSALPSPDTTPDAMILPPVLHQVQRRPIGPGTPARATRGCCPHRPPRRRLTHGLYAVGRDLGDPDRYTVIYDIWNYRASPGFAEIILEETDTAQTDADRPAK